MNDFMLGVSSITPTSIHNTEAYRGQLKEASNEFESILAAQMFKAMRETVMHSDLLQPSTGRNIYEDMLHSEVARVGSHTHGFGLGETIFRALSANLPDVPAAASVPDTRTDSDQERPLNSLKRTTGGNGR